MRNHRETAKRFDFLIKNIVKRSDFLNNYLHSMIITFVCLQLLNDNKIKTRGVEMRNVALISEIISALKSIRLLPAAV